VETEMVQTGSCPLCGELEGVERIILDFSETLIWRTNLKFKKWLSFQ
jgi:hypothetical protein